MYMQHVWTCAELARRLPVTYTQLVSNMSAHAENFVHVQKDWLTIVFQRADNFLKTYT